MANKLYEESSIQDIADAIRSKNGSSDTYTVSEMSTAIENIPSGGGGASDYFVSEINTTDIKTAIKKLPPLKINLSGYFNNVFSYCINLEEVEELDLSSVTRTQYCFDRCRNLKSVNLITTSSLNSVMGMFNNCTSLIAAPEINTTNVTTTYSMFYGCSSLTTVPEYNLSSVTNITNMFRVGRNLNDTSLDNILKSCISAVSYTGTKTLSELGLGSSNYPASRIQALPHYQDFINAGWSIGY